MSSRLPASDKAELTELIGEAIELARQLDKPRVVRLLQNALETAAAETTLPTFEHPNGKTSH